MTATRTVQRWIQRTAHTGTLALLMGSLIAMAMPATQQAHADTSMPEMGGSGVDTSDSSMDMQMTPITGTPTAADWAKVASVLASTKAATSQYADIHLAIADGYTHHTAFFPYAHFSNYQYAALANRTFDPTKPTSLLYAMVKGAPTLAAVMYTAPATDTAAQLAQLLPSTIVSWHQHFSMCYTAAGGVKTGVAQSACEAGGGHWSPKSQWMVHAWIYFPNPDGMFSIKNPALPWPRYHR